MNELAFVGGRYRASHLLKEKPGTMVFLGTDDLTKDRVIIKILSGSALSPTSQVQFDHQAKVLRLIRTDELMTPLWWESKDDRACLVTKYVPGVTLHERLTKSGRLSYSKALLLARSLLVALRELHTHGIVHRDLKPTNIIIEEKDGSLRATLIDFGLAGPTNPAQASPAERAGTALYTSPEQAGLIEYSVGPRSDLYSLGVVLYESLCASNPFAGTSVGEVLRNHLIVRPPSIARNLTGIPHLFDEWLRRIMQKDPRDRYQTAEGALSDLEELLTAFNDGDREPSFVLGRMDLHCSLTEPSFVGRASELVRLNEIVKEAKEGKPGLFFVEAESGGGKSRLLEELCRRGIAEGMRVFRARGMDQVARRPFQILVTAAEQIAAEAALDPKLSERLARGLGDFAGAAANALPELSSCLRFTKDESEPEGFGEVRTVEAITRILDSLGVAEQPVLLLLDDCQWADALTVSLLEEWYAKSRRSDQSGYLCIIAAYRTEEVLDSHKLREMDAAGRLVLPSLESTEIRELIRSMTGPLPEDCLRLVESLSHGSPFMASAVLRGLTETGALFPGKSGWQFEEERLANPQSSRQAASLLSKRIQLLPTSCLRLLTAGALLGKEFPLGPAAALGGISPELALDVVEEAVRRHLIWTRQGDVVAFVHDKIRETLLERLAPEERRMLHARAAELLESRVERPIFDLAFHFDAAGDSGRALPYALMAAKHSRARHSLETAEQLYRIAEKSAAETDRKTRLEIAEGLADILMLRGNYEAAEKALIDALSLARGRLDQARLQGKRGELAFKRGDPKTASAELEQALHHLGKYIPASPVALSVLLLWEIVIQALHTLFPKVFLGRKQTGPDSESELLAIRMFSRLAYAYWFHRGKLPCLWAHLREMNLAERYPATAELAQAYSEHGPVMSMLPWFSRGIQYAEKSLVIRRARHDRWGEGQSLHFLGVILYAASRYEDCIEKCREAVRLLESVGDRWEMNTANWHIGFSLYRLGDLKASELKCREVHESGVRLGDVQAAGIGISGWTKATHGRIEKEILQSQLIRQTGDIHTKAEIMTAEAIYFLQQGAPLDAVRILQKAQRMIRKSGMQQEYVAPVLPWLTTALRTLLQQERASALPHHSAKTLKEAWRVGKQALAVARKYRNNLPHILRELALLSIERGNAKEAFRYFEGSRKIADAQKARHELMQTLAARARFGELLGWESAGEDKKEAEALHLSIFEAAEEASSVSPTLSLVDRFEMILDVGRRLASSLTQKKVWEAVDEAGIKLLRAERCLIFQRAPEGAPRLISASRGKEFSHSIVESVLDTGEKKVFVSDTSPEISESLRFQEVRSAICWPINVRGKTAACFYATHSEIGAVFGNEEEKLAEFIAVLAGAALENAEGFERLMALNSELEAQKRLLGRSNADLERFAFLASHDLKEPLRCVIQNVQLLSKRYQGKIDAEADRCIRYSVEGASRMYSMIDGLLTYSRAGLEQGAQTKIALTDCLEGVLQSLEKTITEQRAVVTCDNLPECLLNATVLQHVLQNLLTNALKFRRSESPNIQIRAKRGDQQWIVSVTDNGIGIAEKHQERIFTLFQRLHDREKYAGSGIGLAVCKKMIEAIGGKIWVRSEEGKGATFFFSIPDESAPPSKKGS